MLSKFLSSVIRWDISRNGSKRLLPYLYYDNYWIAGIYTASTSKVKNLLPTSELRPIELFPGRCLVAFAFFDYKKTDEGFYKEMKNLYEFKNAPQLNPLDDSIEAQFTAGQGEAYGLEFFINKMKGRFSGWIGYTLSWPVRQFDELNGGKKYYSKYDRRNDFSIVLSYSLLEGLNLGLTWIYATGQRYTLPPGQFIFDPIGISGTEEIQFNYTGINTTRFPDYHKLDLNVNYSFNMFNADFKAYINLYNVYNRHNAFAQYIVLEKNEDGEEVPVVKRITLFPFIPSAGVAIKF